MAFLNEVSPIDVTSLGIVTDLSPSSSLETFGTTYVRVLVSSDPFEMTITPPTDSMFGFAESMVTLDSLLESPNPGHFSSVLGMETDTSEVHPVNAPSPTLLSFVPERSNSISSLQFENALTPIVVRVAGNDICVRGVLLNAPCSMDANDAFDASTVVSEEHPWNALCLISTENPSGNTTFCSDVWLLNTFSNMSVVPAFMTSSVTPYPMNTSLYVVESPVSMIS